LPIARQKTCHLRDNLVVRITLAFAFCLTMGFSASIQRADAETSAIAAPVLKWQYGGCFNSWCQTGWYGSPAIIDIDKDGATDVLWASYDLVALNGATGALKWRATNSQRAWTAVAVADLTGDGSLEAVVGRGGNQVTVYSASGQTLWTRAPFSSGNEVRSLALADLDGDGAIEIVTGRAGSGATRQINVHQANGMVRPGWPARRDGEAGYGWGMYNQNITVADLDGDGDKEIIGPTDTHYITALDDGGNQLPANALYTTSNPQGLKVWSQVGVHVDHSVDLRGYANCGSEHRPNFANSAPVAGDLDGDGSVEIVVPGDVYNCAVGDNAEGDLYLMPWIFKRDRTRWSGSGFDWTTLPAPAPNARPLSEDYTVIENSVTNAVLADLDNDGLKEILYPSYDGRLHVYWLDKTQHGSWPYDVPGTGIRFMSEPVVADLDNDGSAEVIFTSWPQKSVGGVGRLHVLSALGAPLQAVDLPAALSGNYNGGLGAPSLGNIDADPDLEVVLGTISAGVVAYDLPGTADARVLWATGRGGLMRAGLAEGPSCARLTLTIAPANGGSVESSPPNCATGEGYTPGSSVTVTTTAASGSTFLGWSGALLSPQPVIAITLQGDKALIANFRTFTVAVSVWLPAIQR
jgi:FG-GAP-like repeat/Divergent InlB B-repeat domain